MEEQQPEASQQQAQQESNQSQLMRENFVQNSVNFLTHPSVQSSSEENKNSFLLKKGVTQAELDEAYSRVNKLPKSTQITTTTQQEISPSQSKQPIQVTQGQPALKPWETQTTVVPIQNDQRIIPQNNRGIVAYFRRTSWFQLFLASSALAGIGVLFHTYAWPILYKYIQQWLERRRQERELKIQTYNMLASIKGSMEQQNKLMSQALQSLNQLSNKQDTQGQMLLRTIRQQDGINEAINKLNYNAQKSVKGYELVGNSYHQQNSPTYSQLSTQKSGQMYNATGHFQQPYNSRINDPPLFARAVDEPLKFGNTIQNSSTNITTSNSKAGSAKEGSRNNIQKDHEEDQKIPLDEVVKMVQNGITPPNVQTKVDDSPKNQNGKIELNPARANLKPWEVDQTQNQANQSSPQYKQNYQSSKPFSNRQSISLDSTNNDYFDNGFLGPKYEENQVEEIKPANGFQGGSSEPYENGNKLGSQKISLGKSQQGTSNAQSSNTNRNEEENNFLNSYTSWTPPPLPKSALENGLNQNGVNQQGESSSLV